jgi:ankyrin repeat protein
VEFSKHFLALDPRHADLGRLKRHAKELQDAFDARNEDARALVVRHLPKHARDERLKLAYAQFVIARTHGFKSWARLKAYVEARQLGGAQLRDAALALAFESNDFALEAVFDRRDELETRDVFVAAVLADVEALTELIAASPELVNAPGGPRNCPPLVYLCHSQLGKYASGFRERQVEAARLLLTHGADANSGTPKDADGHSRSALYGSVRSPGHPELCELLLEHGARASDGESLYHASELKSLRCLALLLAHGPDDQDREWCIVRMIDQDNPEGIRLYLENGTNPNHLCRALFRERSIACLRVLIEYGADVNEVCEDDWLRKRVAGLTPAQIAERSGYDAAVELLLKAGANDNRGPRDFLIGACARGDRAAAERVLAANPKLVASLTPNDHSYLSAFARAGNRSAVEIMLDVGFDVEAKADDMVCSGFVYAATNGDVRMLRLLLDRGANLEASHMYGGNALGTAIYCAANFRNPAGDYAGAVDLLLHAGLEPRDDMLPFALDHGLDDVAAVLIAHGGEPPDEPA